MHANLSLTHWFLLQNAGILKSSGPHYGFYGSRLRCGVAMHIEKASAGDPLGSINVDASYQCVANDAVRKVLYPTKLQLFWQTQNMSKLLNVQFI